MWARTGWTQLPGKRGKVEPQLIEEGAMTKQEEQELEMMQKVKDGLATEFD